MFVSRIAVLSTAGLMLLGARQLQGQRVQLSLQPGTRVRVVTESLWRPTVAILVGRRADVLLLDVMGQPELAVPLSTIRQLEVSRGRSSKVVTGATTGFLVGTAATAVFLLAFCSDPDTACQTDEFVRAFSIIALPSTALGAAVGLAIRIERWEGVPLGNDHGETEYWMLTLQFGF